jgi:hypothetical protein
MRLGAFTKGLIIMSKSAFLLSIPFIYAGFMLYKSPTIADAIIVLSLSALVGAITYFSHKFDNTYREDNKELRKLREELEIERTKASIEHIKENMIRDKASRDARNAVLGNISSGEIRF